MSKTSKKKLPNELSATSVELLLHNLRRIQTAADTGLFLDAFFTPTEKNTILRRLAVVTLLHNGKTYRTIETALEISRATISKIQHIAQGDGYGKNLGKRTYSSNTPAEKKKRKRLFRPYKGAQSIV